MSALPCRILLLFIVNALNRVAASHPNKGLFSCQPEQYNEISLPPWCDTRLTFDARARLLVKNLTVAECVEVVLKRPVQRVGVPGYAMWAVESLHGVRLGGRCPYPDRCTTVFPPASATARSFNATLWRNIGVAMGTEMRVLFNLGKAEHDLSGTTCTFRVDIDAGYARSGVFAKL